MTRTTVTDVTVSGLFSSAAHGSMGHTRAVTTQRCGTSAPAKKAMSPNTSLGPSKDELRNVPLLVEVMLPPAFRKLLLALRMDGSFCGEGGGGGGGQEASSG